MTTWYQPINCSLRLTGNVSNIFNEVKMASMSACNFSIPFTGPVSDMVCKARTAVEGQGGVFSGNDASGNFNVSLLGNGIDGSYSVNGQLLDVMINAKPLFIPCSAIRHFLEKQLG